MNNQTTKIKNKIKETLSQEQISYFESHYGEGWADGLLGKKRTRDAQTFTQTTSPPNIIPGSPFSLTATLPNSLTITAAYILGPSGEQIPILSPTGQYPITGSTVTFTNIVLPIGNYSVVLVDSTGGTSISPISSSIAITSIANLNFSTNTQFNSTITFTSPTNLLASASLISLDNLNSYPLTFTTSTSQTATFSTSALIPTGIYKISTTDINTIVKLSTQQITFKLIVNFLTVSPFTTGSTARLDFTLNSTVPETLTEIALINQSTSIAEIIPITPITVTTSYNPFYQFNQAAGTYVLRIKDTFGSYSTSTQSIVIDNGFLIVSTSPTYIKASTTTNITVTMSRSSNINLVQLIDSSNQATTITFTRTSAVVTATIPFSISGGVYTLRLTSSDTTVRTTQSITSINLGSYLTTPRTAYSSTLISLEINLTPNILSTITGSYISTSNSTTTTPINTPVTNLALLSAGVYGTDTFLAPGGGDYYLHLIVGSLHLISSNTQTIIGNSITSFTPLTTSSSFTTPQAIVNTAIVQSDILETYLKDTTSLVKTQLTIASIAGTTINYASITVPNGVYSYGIRLASETLTYATTIKASFQIVSYTPLNPSWGAPTVLTVTTNNDVSILASGSYLFTTNGNIPLVASNYNTSTKTITFNSITIPQATIGSTFHLASVTGDDVVLTGPSFSSTTFTISPTSALITDSVTFIATLSSNINSQDITTCTLTNGSSNLSLTVNTVVSGVVTFFPVTVSISGLLSIKMTIYGSILTSTNTCSVQALVIPTTAPVTVLDNATFTPTFTTTSPVVLANLTSSKLVHTTTSSFVTLTPVSFVSGVVTYQPVTALPYGAYNLVLIYSGQTVTSPNLTYSVFRILNLTTIGTAFLQGMKNVATLALSTPSASLGALGITLGANSYPVTYTNPITSASNVSFTVPLNGVYTFAVTDSISNYVQSIAVTVGALSISNVTPTTTPLGTPVTLTYGLSQGVSLYNFTSAFLQTTTGSPIAITASAGSGAGFTFNPVTLTIPGTYFVTINNILTSSTVSLTTSPGIITSLSTFTFGTLVVFTYMVSANLTAATGRLTSSTGAIVTLFSTQAITGNITNTVTTPTQLTGTSYTFTITYASTTLTSPVILTQTPFAGLQYPNINFAGSLTWNFTIPQGNFGSAIPLNQLLTIPYEVAFIWTGGAIFSNHFGMTTTSTVDNALASTASPPNGVSFGCATGTRYIIREVIINGVNKIYFGTSRATLASYSLSNLTVNQNRYFTACLNQNSSVAVPQTVTFVDGST